MYIFRVVPETNQRVAARFAQARRSDHYPSQVEVQVWCRSCKRWLPHRWPSCPRLRLSGKPASRCACGIHTCYDAAAMGVEDTPETGTNVYRDFD